MHRLVLLHPDLRFRSAQLALDGLYPPLDGVLRNTLHQTDEVLAVVGNLLLGDVQSWRLAVASALSASAASRAA